MGRAPCCAKVGLHRGPWTPKEDSLLISYINTHGEGQWRSLPKKAGLLRCGKSCRLRWMNYLRPDIKRGNITPDEDDLIIRLHALLGNRWSLIAGRLPGRTDNEIKNYWNTHLSKKLRAQGIDPETHKKLPLIIMPTDADADADDVVIDPVRLLSSPKSKKNCRKNTNSKKNKHNSISKKKNKNNKLPRPAAAAAANSSSTNEPTTIIKTNKVHLPKAVRLTAPLSLTRNSSNASFESNLTTSCLTPASSNCANSTTTTTITNQHPLSWPPTLCMDHDSQGMLPTEGGDYIIQSSTAASGGGGVQFLIGCEEDEGEDHGKFEKLYDEYLQLIKVGDDHDHHMDSSCADFSYSPTQDHDFDLFAESLLI